MKDNNFEKMSVQEKINYIKSNLPRDKNLLRQEISEFDENALNVIYRIVMVNQLVTEQIPQLIENLDYFNENAVGNFREGLESLNVPDNVRKQSVSIFEEKVIPVTKRVANELKAAQKKVHDTFILGVAALKGVKVLESIIEFRKEIEKKFPGIADKIIIAGTNGLVSLLSSHIPVVGGLLVSLNLGDKLNRFLKIDNLESTLQTLKDKIDIIDKDKELARIKKTAEKLNKLGEITKVPVITLQKLNLNDESLQKIINNIQDNPSAKEYIDYIGKVAIIIPADKKQIDGRLKDFEKSFHQIVKGSNLAEVDEKKLEKIFQQNLTEAKKTWEKGIRPNNNFYDKIIAQQQVGAILDRTITQFNTPPTKSAEGKAKIDSLSKSVSELTVKSNITLTDPQMIDKAKKSIIASRELGLNSNVSVRLIKTLPQPVSRSSTR